MYDDNTGVETVGFENPDGSLVVVVLNKFSNALEITLDVGGGDTLVTTLAARSVSTLIF